MVAKRSKYLYFAAEVTMNICEISLFFYRVTMFKILARLLQETKLWATPGVVGLGQSVFYFPLQARVGCCSKNNSYHGTTQSQATSGIFYLFQKKIRLKKELFIVIWNLSHNIYIYIYLDIEQDITYKNHNYSSFFLSPMMMDTIIYTIF